MRRLVKWRMARRFSQYPEDLENESGMIRTLSPSFQYYIDINRSTNKFVIKDIFAQAEIYKIPQHLMNLDEESVKEIMNRFKWVDD